MSDKNFDFDLLDEIINNAPTAGFGPQMYFGLMKMDIEIMSWTGSQGARKPVTRPFKTGETVSKDNGEYLQLTFHSDLSEFNPALTNEYKRRVDVKHSNKSGAPQKWTLTDFDETVFPAMQKVFGKDAFKKLTKGVYCSWQDVDTVEKNKDGKLKGFFRKDRETGELTDVYLVNSVPQFLQAFKSKAECAAAREARFAKNESADIDLGEGDDIPDAVVKEAAALIGAVGEASAKEILSSNAPYNQYDTTALMAAAAAK